MMDLQATTQVLGNIGEFLGAIAVVGTLGFLALQVRQNTRSSYSERAAAITHRLSEVKKAIICDSEMAILMARCRNPHIGDLTLAEAERVQGIAEIYLQLFGSVQTAHRNSEMTDAYFDNYRTEFKRIVETYPGLKPPMRQVLQNFDPAFWPIYGPALE